jgi:hypothetical protein
MAVILELHFCDFCNGSSNYIFSFYHVAFSRYLCYMFYINGHLLCY